MKFQERFVKIQEESRVNFWVLRHIRTDLNNEHYTNNTNGKINLLMMVITTIIMMMMTMTKSMNTHNK